jgi:histidinol-phosphate aminotransferase
MPESFDPAKRCNDHVAKLREYRVTSQDIWKMAKTGDIVKADWNESGAAPSPRVNQALQAFLKGIPLEWYPDVEATKLREALAEYCNCTVDQTQVFSGSDAALEYFCRAFLNPGDEVIIRTPTYDNFRVYVESNGGQVVAVHNSSPFELDITAITKAITPKTKLIYLVNPCNPTGIVYSEAQLETILKAAPQAIIISDEAYFEFYGKTVVPLLKKYQNLVISRSFSKAFALAGLRIGYLIADPAVLAVVNKIRVGKNVNSIAQIAAEAALTDIPYLNKYVKDVTRNREWLVAELTKLGYVARTTVANFILVQVDNPTAFASHLKNEWIYVRDRSYMPQMEGFVRITVGTKEQAQRIVTACERYLELSMMISF